MHTAIQARAALRTTLRTTAASTSRLTRYNSTSTMHENDPELLEREKHRNLTKSQHKTSTPHQKEAPGWNESLASQSEANVKADRSTGSPQDLQSETIRYLRTRHQDAEGSEANTVAYYSHDTVTGPLSSAEGKEEVLVHECQVVENEKIYDSIAAELAHKMRPTESEENVKADRGEI